MASKIVMQKAREYLVSHNMLRSPEAVDSLSDVGVRLLFNYYYIGGWSQFLSDRQTGELS